jgi:hypothetical protein
MPNPHENGPRKVDISEIYGAEEARAVIRDSIKDYEEVYGTPSRRFAELADLISKMGATEASNEASNERPKSKLGQ